MKNNPEIKSLSDQEIKERIASEKMSLMRMRFAHAVNQLDRPSTMKNVRKNIARLFTELNSRKQSAN